MSWWTLVDIRFHIHFNRKPAVFWPGLFGLVGSLRASQARPVQAYQENKPKETKGDWLLDNIKHKTGNYLWLYGIHKTKVQHVFTQTLSKTLGNKQAWTEVYDVQIMTVID